MRLQNKTAVVTGAASGMGRAISQVFAREGANVIVADINEQGGKETVALVEPEGGDGGEAVFVATDVTRPEQIKAAVDHAVERFGAIDVMVNNAGGGGSTTVLDTDEAEFHRMVDLNLKGMFFGSKYAIEVMIPRGGGSIVSTASITGMRGQDYLGPYGAAKAGVINLTQHLAWVYGPLGIRANAVSPGAIDTPMLRAGAGDPAQAPVMAYFRHQSPLHRIGRAEDIANTTLFLACDDSAHVTGQVIPVDGGITCGTFLDPVRIRELATDALATG